ncbi:substrate-binding domain-containing protein [Rhizobium giardinii]|uniref:substrate-binding domain-containing protein n=1 Tax=Rhizobium giardinii TaxID=56731 RepID=UPI0039DF4E98
MVVAEISNPFFGTILREVEDRALELEHMVIVSDTDAKPDRELAILDRLSALRVAGIIYSPHGESEEVVQHVSLSIPLVTIDHKLEGLEVDFVSSDNLLASAMLTEPSGWVTSASRTSKAARACGRRSNANSDSETQ